MTVKNLVIRKLRTEPTLEMLKGLKPRRILDLGCGNGHITKKVAEMFPDAKIEAMDRFLPPDVLLGNYAPNIEYSVQDFWDPIPGRYDLVIMTQVLEHLMVPERLLKKAFQLAPWVMVSVPLEPRFTNWSLFGESDGHVQKWTPEEFKRFCKRYARIADYKISFLWQLALLKAPLK